MQPGPAFQPTGYSKLRLLPSSAEPWRQGLAVIPEYWQEFVRENRISEKDFEIDKGIFTLTPKY